MFNSQIEWDQFLSAVLVRVAGQGVDSFISQVLHIHANEISGSTPKVRLDNALKFMVNKGFFHQPALVETLLTHLEDIGMDCTIFRQRLLLAKPPIFHSQSSVWGTPLLPGYVPFFDREQARQSLEDLLIVEPDNNPGIPFGSKPPRVCAIINPSEPRRQGRTQLYHYLRYRVSLQPWRPGLDLAYINFREHQILRPDNFLAALAAELETQEPVPVQGASLEADWHREIVEWLMQVCLQSNKWWFFVFDNFDDKKVPPQTLALIDFLVWFLTLEPESRAYNLGSSLAAHYAPPMRLVLLGYDAERFQLLKRENRIGNRLCQLTLGPIEEQHIIACLKAILLHRQESPAEAEFKAQKVAEAIMSALDEVQPSAEERLHMLRSTTQEAIHRMGWCPC